MEVLSSRIIVDVADLDRSRRFYEDSLGLRISREYGAQGVATGVVYFLGGGFLEVTTGHHKGKGVVSIWLQVPDVAAEETRLAAAGVPIRRRTERMPWGLVECWIEDPDGVDLCLVEVPDDHPIRSRLR